MDKALLETGHTIRREVLGAEHVDRATANMDAFNRRFQEFMTEYCWGGVWSQPVLDRKQRSLNNLCILSALNRPEEFKAHVRGAINNGVSREEISEVLLQCAIYCGVPAAISGFRAAKQVFDEMD